MACDILPPDGGVVKVPGGGLLIAGGLAVPASGVSGYSAGCVFHQLDGAAGSTLYLNEGTFASCDFNAVSTSLTLASYATTASVTSSLASYLPLAGGTLADAANIAVDTTTGTKIGTAVGQKIGFWNATPVVQPTSANQGSITLDVDVSGGDTVDKAAINTNFTNIETLLLAIRTALIDTGIIKGSS